MFIDDKNCPLCKTLSHFLVIKDSFQHFKCPNVNCALIFVYPPPSNLDDVYKCNVDFEAHNSNDLIDSPKVKSNLNISIARRLITERGLSKVLDVGCGSGNFILGIQDLGSEVIGVEPNKHAASHCKRLGLNVRNEFFSAVNLNKGEVDLINSADVIKHVADPRSLIKDAINLMSERGILIIRTPNLESLV
jgi:2-polyprenyl-3-methyl-5-hydroxy-6-metoxy-1,4-benzoquinol methylase